MKEGLPKRYVDRARLFLELVRKYGAIRNGQTLLELGTGWVHWESTCLRLLYDADFTLFDVWDNRLFNTFKLYFAEFAREIDQAIEMSPAERERVHRLLTAIGSTKSFDDLYQLLGFRYIIEPSGTLSRFHDESFDAIFSCDVLEHVDRDMLASYIQDFNRILKPGGYSIHQIDIADHLAYYDSAVSKKNYLRYSNRAWNLFFENDVQYFNRVQRSEWLSLFDKAGLVLVEQVSLPYNADTIRVHKSYENLEKQDLECITLRVVHRKPG